MLIEIRPHRVNLLYTNEDGTLVFQVEERTAVNDFSPLMDITTRYREGTPGRDTVRINVPDSISGKIHTRKR